jgi:two-component system, OmpR family, copper resistance phosphate regulon response regulator CusR
LVVDDDPRLRDLLVRGLTDAGYDCAAATGPSQARERLARDAAPDLMLVDVMMPDEDGWTFLERLRRTGNTTPAIFLTARDSVPERVKGLELGADDYLIKPFDFQELLARVSAVLRRRAGPRELRVGDLALDLDQRHVELAGKRIELSPREYELLLALARRAGRVCTRAELLSEVWDIEFEPGTNTVDVHVARLRKRLGPRDAARLETVHGEGYRLRLQDEA